MRPFVSSAARLRSLGGRYIRRLGLVPGGEPDGLGEDDDLGELALGQRVAVFFPEPARNAYQLEQWLRPLEALDERLGVVVLTQDSRATARLRGRTGLPVVCAARTATLDGLVARSELGMVLYVSHHPRNFQMLRFPALAHVHLGHGDSDKSVSASNQLKAYDRSFVAGQAAVDRIASELIWFDLDRLVPVGRPQSPVSALASGPRVGAGGPVTVLYAPTWEGAQASMAYSSVLSHGDALVRSLLAEGMRVVYRPHPRTGANSRDVAQADAAIRALVTGSSGSAVVRDVPLPESFAIADALVTDVSSLAVEWLPTGRPLVVTEPANPQAAATHSPLLDAVPRLTTGEAGAAGTLVRRCLERDDAAPTRRDLLEYYLGDVTEGSALRRFLEECGSVLAARTVAVANRSMVPR